ncbi:microsomal glutathione S-transferase 1 isoform X1 [Falco peregrinus]|nr:microsomal glutathione S-transferase 1 isoform X1 [Falco peregrinus]XP_055664590.1 microsomal glutathione S-transferase 1 isoform X1 [Falco peregrinus]XP_055664597.1 microsomal glutathione S-transferase 1 isoform X1 [Falco peregrinus]
MAKLTQLIDNEVFRAYATYTTIVLLKMMLMSLITAYFRITRKAFVNPEDTASFGKGESAKKYLRTDPDVERGHKSGIKSMKSVELNWRNAPPKRQQESISGRQRSVPAPQQTAQPSATKRSHDGCVMDKDHTGTIDVCGLVVPNMLTSNWREKDVHTGEKPQGRPFFSVFKRDQGA